MDNEKKEKGLIFSNNNNNEDMDKGNKYGLMVRTMRATENQIIFI